MTTALLDKSSPQNAGAKPLAEGKQPVGIMVALWAFVIIPFLALIAAVPVAWGGWLSWTDIVIGGICYVVAGMGITVGFHRYLTHGSFKAKRWLRITLAIAGSMALQGDVTQWVADHRRHHAYSDLEGDPHSPWRVGTGFWALTKGPFHAHTGWHFHPEQSNLARFTPDLVADKDIDRIDRYFPLITIVSMLAPAAAGGLITWAWEGAPRAVFLARPGRVSP